jgi:hypothetical protein
MFLNAVQSLPSGVTSDDPFGGGMQPSQLAHHALWTVALAGRVFNSILSDIVAGKEPHQIVAGVRSVLLAAPAGRAARGAPTLCDPRSRRLVPPGRAA